MVVDNKNTIGMVSLGCAKNLVDAEVMLGHWVDKGFSVVEDLSLAEVIVVNTCAFLQCAVEEGVDRILEVAKYKESGCCQKLIVAGCMTERYRDKLIKEFPEVDAFVSTDELLHVDTISGMTAECRNPARRATFLYDHDTSRIISSAAGYAYVKIADGCNRPCAFCIIPKIRGRYRSRQRESVVKEVKNLLAAGRKEINLIAQDVTFYGQDFHDQAGGLISLLKNIVAETKQTDFWLRLLYAFPDGVSKELVELIKNEKVICDYLDLPLQHISAEILKKMKRPWGQKKTRELLDNIKSWHPALALRTSFIVGFPGETEDDVEQLADFIRQTAFHHVGVFTYSHEEEASSSVYRDDVPAAEKTARMNYLMAIQQDIVAKRQHGLIGTVGKILVEGYHADSDMLVVGRSETLAPEVDGQVIINEISPDCLPADGVASLFGRYVLARYSEACGYDITAEIISLTVD